MQPISSSTALISTLAVVALPYLTSLVWAVDHPEVNGTERFKKYHFIVFKSLNSNKVQVFIGILFTMCKI
jgi:hypothetical protein